MLFRRAATTSRPSQSISTPRRAQEHPRRLQTVQLHFDIRGDVPEAAVERAIASSRTTYCSVWASFRQDIELTVTFTIRPPMKA